MKRFWRVNKAIVRNNKIVFPTNSIVFEDGAVWGCSGVDDYYYFGHRRGDMFIEFADKPYSFGRMQRNDKTGFKVVTLQDLAKQDGNPRQ